MTVVHDRHIRAVPQRPLVAMFVAMMFLVGAIASGGAADARMRPPAAGDLLYVVVNGGQQAYVEIFPLDAVLANANPKPLTKIAGLPNPDAVAVAQNEDFYVSDRFANAVFVFHKGHIQPYRQLRIDISAPADVAIGNDGTLYVLNLPQNRSPYVTVYAPNQRKPDHRIVAFGGTPTCLHVDASGNLYVGAIAANGSGVLQKFAPGATTGTPVALQNLPIPTSVSLDASGSFVLTGTVDTATTSLSVLALYQSSLPSIDAVPSSALHAVLTANEGALLVADGNAGAVNAYFYPYFETALALLPFGLNSYITGIATSPADPN